MTYEKAKRSARSYLEYLKRYETEVTSQAPPRGEPHEQFLARFRGLLSVVENADRNLQEVSDALFPTALRNYIELVEAKLRLNEDQRKVELLAASLTPPHLAHDEFVKKSHSFLSIYRQLQYNPPGSMEVTFNGNNLNLNITGNVQLSSLSCSKVSILNPISIEIL